MATTVTNTSGTGVTTVVTMALDRLLKETANVAAYEVATPATIYDVSYYRSAIFNVVTSLTVPAADTVTVEIQHSTDGTNFTQLCVTPTIDQAAVNYPHNGVATAANIGKYIRVHQLTGSAGIEVGVPTYSVYATLKK
jgi:hypothetical protein